MPQFDVHRNQGALKDAIAFVVIVQSSLFNGYKKRVVMPLVRRTVLPLQAKSAGQRLNPEFSIEDISVVRHPPDMVSVASDQLGPYVLSLAQSGQVITDALDELLTRSQA